MQRSAKGDVWVLKKLFVSAVSASLIASPVLAAPAAPAMPAQSEVTPAPEQIGGAKFWESSSALLLFAGIVAIGVAIALLVDTHDKPASP